MGEIGIHVEAEVFEVLEAGEEAFDLDLVYSAMKRRCERRKGGSERFA